MKLQPKRYRPPEMAELRVDEDDEKQIRRRWNDFSDENFSWCNHHHHYYHHQSITRSINFSSLNYNNFLFLKNNSIIVVLLIILTKLCSLSSSSQTTSPSSLHPMMLRHHLHHHHHHHHHNHHILSSLHHPVTTTTATRNGHHHHHHQYYHRHPSSPLPVSLAPYLTSSSSSSSVWRQMAIRSRALTRRHRHPYYHYYDDQDQEDVTSTTTTTTTEQSPTMAPSKIKTKVIYQHNWIKSDDQLPICESWQVCNKIDTYSTPWIEKQCRCSAGHRPCSTSFDEDDFTIVDKTKQYKLCEPVKKLPTCKYFRDVTWTITTTSMKIDTTNTNSLVTGQPVTIAQQHQNENITRQEMKCQCPANSVAYILKHQVYRSPDMPSGQLGYRYHFACSPETKLRCKRKEPCRLFMSRKRSKVEEVTPTTLCQCGSGYQCPSNHRHLSVKHETVYPLDNVRTYSGYCYRETDSEQTDLIDEHADQS